MALCQPAEWRNINRQQEGLVVVSTKAGQNVLNGVKRLRLGVVPPTKSDPRGVKIVIEPPRGINPLMTSAPMHNRPPYVTWKSGAGYILLKNGQMQVVPGNRLNATVKRLGDQVLSYSRS